jgi:hypothetical protein
LPHPVGFGIRNGGDKSLLATRLTARLRDALDFELPIRPCFEAAT